MSALLDLAKSKASPETMAEAAIADGRLLEEMLEALAPENHNEGTRYASHQALVLLSDRHPDLLYGQWDYFASLLHAEKSHPRFNAIYILANLTRIDAEHRFDDTFRAYFDLLDDESVVVAMHTARNAGKIARFRPDLQPRITGELLNIGTGKRLRPERADLVRAYAIEAFGEYFAETDDKDRIVEFVQRCLDSTSPKTRKLAKEFLGKMDLPRSSKPESIL